MVMSTKTSNHGVLEITKIQKRFSLRKSALAIVLHRAARFVTALDDITIQAAKGETLALLGESGSGKTTLGRIIVGLEKSDSGQITLDGQLVGYVRDKSSLRGRLQMVFQNPGSSLDPFMKVGDCVAEPLRGSGLDRNEIRRRVPDALRSVGLDESLMSVRSIELSIGQRQRVAIARAIVGEPEVIVLDEPTSSIDVSIQAQVLNLLVGLQQAKGYTYVLISHDPSVARYMADKIAIMYSGKILEYGGTEDVLTHPKHPYTKALLSSIPSINKGKLPSTVVGEPPSLVELPKGCRYEERCPYVMPICKARHPPLLQKDGTLVACYLYGREIDDRHDLEPRHGQMPPSPKTKIA
jgi:peptide/nickel transport system ATP-binding protein